MDGRAGLLVFMVLPGVEFAGGDGVLAKWLAVVGFRVQPVMALRLGRARCPHRTVGMSARSGGALGTDAPHRVIRVSRLFSREVQPVTAMLIVSPH